MLDTLREILAETLASNDGRDVSEHASFEALGMDSLEKARFLLEVQDRFGVEVSDADYESIDTLQSVADYLAGHGAKAP